MIAQHFESPEAWPLVAAGAVALTLALALRTARDERRRRALIGRGLGPAAFLPDLVLVIAALSIAVALCGPLFAERRVRIDDTGMDVVLVVDASRSMDARDTPPSRLRRAKQTATDLIAALPAGDRIGLVAFAGRGQPLAPLTPDRDVLARMVERIDSRTALPHGSSLAAGVASALETFELDAERRRAIVLLSDGELPPDGSVDLGRMAERHGVHVHAVLFGREVGATIPAQGTRVMGPDGEPALTRRERERASQLSQATGGTLLLADRWGRVPTQEIVAAVRGGLEAGPSGEPTFERRRVPTPAPFAAVAFALLLLEGPLRRWVAARPRAAAGRHRRTLRARAQRVLPVALVLLAVAGLGATARDLEPHDVALRDLAEAWLRAGANAIEAGDDDAALRAFESAAATALRPDVAGTAHYQIGVWHLKHDDPVRGRDAFLESLRLDPSQLDAVFNLEWSLLAIEARAAADRASPPPIAPPPPEAEPEASDELRDASSTQPEPDEASRSPETPRGHAPEARPSGEVRAQRDGIPTTGPNRETGAEGRPLPDDETLSWWLDLVEDDPGRGQVSDRARGRGPQRGGPPW